MSNKKNETVQNLLRNDKMTYEKQSCTITLLKREKKFIIIITSHETISTHKKLRFTSCTRIFEPF